jgi:hypothetical protein
MNEEIRAIKELTRAVDRMTKVMKQTKPSQIKMPYLVHGDLAEEMELYGTLRRCCSPVEANQVLSELKNAGYKIYKEKNAGS